MHRDWSNPYQKLENTSSAEKRSRGIKTTKNNYCSRKGREKMTDTEGWLLPWVMAPTFSDEQWTWQCDPGGLGSIWFLDWSSGPGTAMTTVLRKALLLKREDFKKHVKTNHIFHLQGCWGHTLNLLKQDPEVPQQQETATLQLWFCTAWGTQAPVVISFGEAALETCEH